MYLQTVFWQEFHESRGDKQICLSSWNRHSALGHVRELRFVSPVKVPVPSPLLLVLLLVLLPLPLLLLWPLLLFPLHKASLISHWCCRNPDQLLSTAPLVRQQHVGTKQRHSFDCIAC